jgi:predicted transcriptional regulator
MDFSQEDLVDAVERLVAGLLERAGVVDAPVDALRIAEEHLGIPVTVAEPEEDERGRPRAGSRSAAEGGIVLSPHATEEQQHAAAAQGIARGLIPDLLRKFGVEAGTENKQAVAYVRSLIVSRLLVPTRQLRSSLRSCKYDVPALKKHFRTASMETIAHRFLDLDSPCVIAIVDDGVVSSRRGNMAAVSKKLTAAEQACLDRVMDREVPDRQRLEGWTVQGWPVPHRPFCRVVLHAVPDDV